MKSETIENLKSINETFYRNVGSYFDNSRNYFWEGWDTLLTHVELPHELDVLDVGCGNGRFFKFMESKGYSWSSYLGLDSNDYLLSSARLKCWNTRAKLRKMDLTKFYLYGEDLFDLTVAFGVLHHIPSFDARIELLVKVCRHVKRGGYLAVSLWDFLSDLKLSKKIVPWEEVGIETGELEPNDYLVGWDRGVSEVRYCHWFPEAEIEKIIEAVPLTLISRFEADGKNKKTNTYLVWKN